MAGLTPRKRPIAKQVSEHDYLLLRHRLLMQRTWRSSRNRHTRANCKLAKRLPSTVGEERMVNGGLQFTPGRQPDAEDFLYTAGKRVRQRPGNKPHSFIQ